MIDLDPEEISTVKHILARFVPLAHVRAFGSRVQHTSKPWSDLDLVVMDEARIPLAVLAELAYEFEESDLPFRVDVLDWHALSEEFRAIVERQCEVVQVSTAADALRS